MLDFPVVYALWPKLSLRADLLSPDASRRLVPAFEQVGVSAVNEGDLIWVNDGSLRTTMSSLNPIPTDSNAIELILAVTAARVIRSSLIFSIFSDPKTETISLFAPEVGGMEDLLDDFRRTSQSSICKKFLE